MTREDKYLLLRDLCGRLPYGVKCKSQRALDAMIGAELLIDINIFGRVNIGGHIKDISDIRPYLFPPQSLPIEQAEEICKAAEGMECGSARERIAAMVKIIDLMNKYRVDYRGLIPMELAYDATNLNIY